MAPEDPWYDVAFRGQYLGVYSYRDDAAADPEAGFALGAIGATSGDPVLDVACGGGRHARAMAARGARVFGLDLSADLLVAALAREAESGPPPAFVRGDMRKLPFAERFVAATMFFTSFGYFGTDEENAGVLAEVARILRPGGRFLLDYLNRESVIAGLVPESVDEREEYTIHSNRSITPDGRRVEKRVRIRRAGRTLTDYRESVRMYEPETVTEMFRAAGFAVERRYGDLAGAAFDSGSPRLVVLGRKAC